MFNQVNVFIRVYDGSIYLLLFGLGKCDIIYNRNRYLISEKWYNICFLTITKIKIDSYNSLPLDKTDYS